MEKIICYVVIAVLLFLCVEYLLRWLLILANRRDYNLNHMLFYDKGIFKTPNSKFKFRYYGLDAKLLLKADAVTNNQGFLSHNDYDFNVPDDSVFKVVVIGGEQTASSVADQSWPDFLEIELTNKFTEEKIKVFNIGWPDAGPEHFVEYWRTIGKDISPDLVIVNYVESDFYRKIAGAELKYLGKPVEGYAEVEYKIDDSSIKTTVPFIAGGLLRKNAQGGVSHVTSFSDPHIIPPRPFGFFADDALMDDVEKISILQKEIVNDMIAGVLPRVGTVMLNIFKARRFKSITSTLRQFDPPPATPVDNDAAVKFVTDNFLKLKKEIENLVITHNFNYDEVKRNVEYALTKLMMKNHPEIDAVDMRDYIPKDKNISEIMTWSMAPTMMEKWSQLGHQVYAKLIVNMLSDKYGDNFIKTLKGS